ncbi:unnamed protein product [Prunus brigantina]
MPDTHEVSPEDVRRAGAEAGKRAPGLRSSLNFGATSCMAITGLLFAGAIGYYTLYVKKKPDPSALDVVRVRRDLDDIRPRKSLVNSTDPAP